MPDATPPAAKSAGTSALRILLAILTVLFAAAAVLYTIGPLWLPNRLFFAQLPFVANSVVKVGILACCCLYARGNLGERLGLVRIVLAAHLISLVAMAILLASMNTNGEVNPGLGGLRPVGQVLVGAMILDGVILALLAVFYFWARRELPASGTTPSPGPAANYLTPAEQLLRTALRGLGVILLLAAAGYELGPILGIESNFFRELPFITNSVVKAGTLALVCFWAASALRTRMSIIGAVIAVHWASVMVQFIYLIAADGSLLVQQFMLLGRTVSMEQILRGAMLLDGVIALVLTMLYLAAWRSRLGCKFLRPTEYRTLIALAEIMIEGEKELITPEEAARNVDRALAEMQTERKIMFRVALIFIHYWPFTSLWPPLPEIETTLRAAYIKRRFQRRAGQKALLTPIRTLLQMFTRTAHQLAVLGYYSDPRAFESIGYVPFSQRPRYATLEIPEPTPLPLKVDQPWDITGGEIETDVLVIGSGAGGAIMAYGLAEAKREVLIVERGQYVEPRSFSEDELIQLGSLYDGGLLQVASDFRFGVLQGSCVGGSTTVNNAICFEPPSEVVDRWNAEYGAGIVRADLDQSTQWVRRFMEVQPLGTEIPPFKFHRGVEKLSAGIGSMPDLKLSMPKAFEANIKQGPEGCYGCGKCNVGCPYDKKLSMLQHTLPRAQDTFPNRVRILANCEVKSIRTLSGQPMRAVDARAQLSDGRWITIKANTYVLSAGALASSHLLQRSGIGKNLPVGEGLCFNMVTPVFAEFDDRMDSFDGIQMGHYAADLAGNRFLLETWYSLPVGLGLAMGGWFQDHFDNMCRGSRLGAYGVVVGTDRKSSVFVNPVTGDMAFRHRPTDRDMDCMVAGLDKLVRALLAGGASRVIVNTWDKGMITGTDQIPALLAEARDPRFLSMASAHPQGGNGLGARGKGVLDDHFRVHGYANLFVCDASSIPSSLQVNPQMTVMALARYAVPRVAQSK